MSTASIRDLRNHGGEVVDRVRRGEHVIITSSGKPVAELRPLSPAPLAIDVLIDRRRRLPIMDPVSLRKDIDAILDQRMW
ncbi:MAG: type II toxin-antitoxin system prevent-host-death family antitoxin [Actinobacteria bacterium]|nr:type II toxin-antitoxin system prevent-host-death family antitoxin [Actinomycetota bacterium]